MKKLSIILLSIIITYIAYSQNHVDPLKIVAVEFKTGEDDNGIPYFEDMTYGIPPAEIVTKIKDLGGNAIRIPVTRGIKDNAKTSVVVNFLQAIKDNGGADLDIILSVRKWNLHLAENREDWAEQVYYTYNAIKTAGLNDMIKGVCFDENAALNDAQSTKELWKSRHQGILDALDILNDSTENDFLTRTVFIHGKGYGSQFLGCKASSDELNFDTEVKKRCNNYCYQFKFFQTGLPADKSLEGWKAQFTDYCKLSEVKELDVPCIFVGDSGDGLRENVFIPNKNPYGGPGQYVIRALRDVFYEYGWSGFSFGAFIRDGEVSSLAKTVMYGAVNGVLSPAEGVIYSWETWYNTTRIVTSINDTKESILTKIKVDSYNKKVNIEAKTNCLVFLYDILGNEIINESISESKSFYLNKAGVYFVKISENNNEETKKILVY